MTKVPLTYGLVVGVVITWFRIIKSYFSSISSSRYSCCDMIVAGFVVLLRNTNDFDCRAQHLLGMYSVFAAGLEGAVQSVTSNALPLERAFELQATSMGKERHIAQKRSAPCCRIYVKDDRHSRGIDLRCVRAISVMLH